MVYSYPALIHKDSDGIWAEFPDLPGCQTFGDTIEEVLENAKEALYCYIIEELDYSGKIPLPSDNKDITVTDNTITKTITVVVEKNNTVMDNNPITMAG